MPTKVYAKSSYVVCREPKSEANETVTAQDAHGRDVLVPRGKLNRGLILLEDKLTTSKTCHELEVVALGPLVKPGLRVGDRVVVYLGGDGQGEVSANGISGFVSIDGNEHQMVQDRFVWAVVRDGEILPRRGVVLTQRDDAAFYRHARGAASLLVLPEANLAGGLSATGSADPTHGGDRTIDAVTALYEKVVRTGKDCDGVARGDTLCFSPSFSACRLKRSVDGVVYDYHLVDSNEAFFVAAE